MEAGLRNDRADEGGSNQPLPGYGAAANAKADEQKDGNGSKAISAAYARPLCPDSWAGSTPSPASALPHLPS